MSDNSKGGFGRPGFERTNVSVMPIGDPNVDDVIDQLYEVLHQAGYALMQGNYCGQAMVVLCKMQQAFGHKFGFEPRAQIIHIVPKYLADQPSPRGVEMRRVSGAVEPPKVTS